MRISRLWSTVPVLLSICLLSWTFLSAHAHHKADMQEENNKEQSYSESGAWDRVAGEESGSSENQDSEANRPGPPHASTVDSGPSGLVVVIKNKPQKDQALDLRALNNPFISGVALPPFPSYPSGQAGFGDPLFQTLRNFYRTDDIPFTSVSDEFNGVTVDNDGNVRPLVPSNFRSLSQAEDENGQSRIYLGIHWAFDKTEGVTQGRRVGNYVFKHAFVPLRTTTPGSR